MCLQSATTGGPYLFYEKENKKEGVNATMAWIDCQNSFERTWHSWTLEMLLTNKTTSMHFTVHRPCYVKMEKSIANTNNRRIEIKSTLYL